MARRGDGLYLRRNTWYLDCRMKGTRYVVWLGRGTTKSVAWEIAQVKRGEIVKGEAGLGGKRTITRTLGELSQEYLAYKRNEGKRTIKDDQRILENRLLPTFGKTLSVRHLTSEAIARYEKHRMGEVTAFTVANELSVLRHMLHKARKWGYLDVVPDFDLPKKPEGRDRHASPEEIRRLLEAATQSQNRELPYVIVLAINTGLRRGSLRNLQWEQVDLDRDMGFNAQITLGRIKNGKPHGVPLNKDVVDALRALQSDPERRAGPVFHEGFDEAFKATVRRARIHELRFHDLRHTNASLLLNQGRSLKEVQEILGHRDFRMTLKYAHLSQAHLRGAVEALDGLTPLPEPEGGVLISSNLSLAR